MKTDCKNRKVNEVADLGIDPATLPGVTVDKADDEKVDKSLVRERTKTLNDNPRDTDNVNM